MTKRLCFTILGLMFIQLSFGQKNSTYEDSVATYFNEIKAATKKHLQLWSTDLYGPILLVNPDTRQVFANFSDSSGFLKDVGEIYSGILPNEINIANTATDWSGRRWAMILLPLPFNKQDRISILAHELFHVWQPSLGFKLFNTGNNHLDNKNGRIYLRLELEALVKWMQTDNKIEQKRHLSNALTFRKYRYSLYPGADSTENLLELNEGIAEYTALIISGRNRIQSIDHFVQSIKNFLSNPTFVRSFAYQTIPIYGYQLAAIKPDWNKEIAINTNLTDFFLNAFGISLPLDLKKTTDLVLNHYNRELIFSEEELREEKTKKMIYEYINKFITQPHFELQFEQMEISFDPRNIVPIADKGTVYQSIRITDKWGILTVENGALLSSNWNKISITVPLEIDNRTIIGDGWTLELTRGYSVIKDKNSGNYKLTKK